MTPQTSYETYLHDLILTRNAALANVESGDLAQARKLHAELVLMEFPGVTAREWLRLDQQRTAALGRVGREIEGAGGV